MKETLRVEWISPVNDKDIIGNSLGYGLANKNMKAALEAQYNLEWRQAPALHFVTPQFFFRVPNKTNIIYCLDPETKILRSDLTWTNVENLKKGDSLIGFDEHNLGWKCKMNESFVEATGEIYAEAYRIITDNGSIICSGNHQFVARRPTGSETNRRLRWFRADELEINDSISMFREPWDQLDNRDGGWLAGFLDGEGCLNKETGGLSGSQKSGYVLDHAKYLLNKYNFKFKIYNASRIRNGKKEECKEIYIHDSLTSLGRIRPVRLLNKSKLIWENKCIHGGEYSKCGKILAIEKLPPRRLIATQTSTGTLISNGFLSHNTMCEHEWLSDDYKIAFEKADAIITVSNFCKSVFERYTDKPIHVCPLGVDTSIWTAKKRVFKPGKQKFRWLYCGAPNLRKFSIMEEVWKTFLKDFVDVELYIKTTGADIPEELGDIVHSNNWIIDNRKLNIKDLVKLYHSAHAMVFLHLGEGYGLCLDPKTLIQVQSGVKPLKDIDVGDFVLSHDGKFNKVLNKVSRNSETLKFNITGCEQLIVTPEHPFLAFKRKKEKFYKLRNININPEWIQAKNLEKGDLVAYPRPKWNNPLMNHIDLLLYTNCENLLYDEKYIWSKMGFSPIDKSVSIKKVSKKYNITKRVAEDALCLLRGRGRPFRGPVNKFNKNSIYPKIAEQIKRDFDIINQEPKKYARYIPIDEEFLEFVGWYIAEGSGSKSTIEIDLHKKEKPIAEKLSNYIKKFGYSTEIKIVDNKCRLNIVGFPLVNLMTKLCGIHAHNKNINDIFWKSADKIGPLVKSYFLGDGNKTGASWRASSVSKNLIYQLRFILASVGIASSIKHYKKRSYGKFNSSEFWVLNISGYSLKDFCKWTGLPYPNKYSLKKRTGSFSIVTNNYIFTTIDKIEIGEEQEVMDLCIENTHSFVGNGIIVHNTAVEAMATQMPLVVSNHTGTLDFCNKTNSFPVSVDMGKIQVLVGKGGDVQTKEIDAGIPSIISAMTQMANVMYKYDKASDIARQAVKDARKLTWENAAKRLKEILENLTC